MCLCERLLIERLSAVQASGLRQFAHPPTGFYVDDKMSQ